MRIRMRFVEFICLRYDREVRWARVLCGEKIYARIYAYIVHICIYARIYIYIYVYMRPYMHIYATNFEKLLSSGRKKNIWICPTNLDPANSMRATRVAEMLQNGAPQKIRANKNTKSDLLWSKKIQLRSFPTNLGTINSMATTRRAEMPQNSASRKSTFCR